MNTSSVSISTSSFSVSTNCHMVYIHDQLRGQHPCPAVTAPCVVVATATTISFGPTPSPPNPACRYLPGPLLCLPAVCRHRPRCRCYGATPDRTRSWHRYRLSAARWKLAMPGVKCRVSMRVRHYSLHAAATMPPRGQRKACAATTQPTAQRRVHTRRPTSCWRRGQKRLGWRGCDRCFGHLSQLLGA